MKSIFFGALLLMLLPLPAAAGQKPPELSAVVRALEAPFAPGAAGSAAIANFRADFAQTSRIASLDREQKGGGTVTVRFDRSAPGNFPSFLWEYKKPSPQGIVSDGHTLWVYLPENQQVIVSKLDRSSLSRAGNPLLFLAELGNLSKGFAISWGHPKRDKAGNYILELVPKRPSPLLQRLQVTVRRRALSGSAPAGKQRVFPLLSTTAFDAGGNSTHIEFSNIRTNRKLPSGFFHFRIPEGVEVLHSLQGLGGAEGK